MIFISVPFVIHFNRFLISIKKYYLYSNNCVCHYAGENYDFSEFFRCYEEDGDSNPEMIMEQALDGNEIMYHSEHPNQSPSVTAPS